jgi:fluoride ion exporter CrcB/FEX
VVVKHDWKIPTTIANVLVCILGAVTTESSRSAGRSNVGWAATAMSGWTGAATTAISMALASTVVSTHLVDSIARRKGQVILIVALTIIAPVFLIVNPRIASRLPIPVLVIWCLSAILSAPPFNFGTREFQSAVWIARIVFCFCLMSFLRTSRNTTAST